MPSAYYALKKVYKAIVPLAVRDQLYRWTPQPVNRARIGVIHALERTAKHDEIYDASYYASQVEPGMEHSAAIIAEDIINAFAPRSAVDVGCGTGNLLLALQERGVACIGFEYSKAAIEICRRRGLSVEVLDIERDSYPGDRADVVISTEVAEHLPASVADPYIDLLCSISTTVIFTAAVPGQSGADHVNEQPHSYWIEKFDKRAFALDSEITDRWRSRWKASAVTGHLWGNLMVFIRRLENPLRGRNALL